MESLPTEILAHVFEQLTKCEICQKNCLRVSRQALQMCSDTCARWNKILEGDFQNFIGKCFPEFEDVISVTIDMKNARSWGLKLLSLYEPFVTSRGMTIFSFNRDGIFSCQKNGGLMALDGKIKGYKLRIATLAPVGDSILQVNDINLVGFAFDEALRILKDVAENQKFRTVKLIVGKNVSFPSRIKVCKIHHI